MRRQQTPGVRGYTPAPELEAAVSVRIAPVVHQWSGFATCTASLDGQEREQVERMLVFLAYAITVNALPPTVIDVTKYTHELRVTTNFINYTDVELSMLAQKVKESGEPIMVEFTRSVLVLFNRSTNSLNIIMVGRRSPSPGGSIGGGSGGGGIGTFPYVLVYRGSYAQRPGGPQYKRDFHRWTGYANAVDGLCGPDRDHVHKALAVFDMVHDYAVMPNLEIREVSDALGTSLHVCITNLVNPVHLMDLYFGLLQTCGTLVHGDFFINTVRYQAALCIKLISQRIQQPMPPPYRAPSVAPTYHHVPQPPPPPNRKHSRSRSRSPDPPPPHRNPSVRRSASRRREIPRRQQDSSPSRPVVIIRHATAPRQQSPPNKKGRRHRSSSGSRSSSPSSSWGD